MTFSQDREKVCFNGVNFKYSNTLSLRIWKAIWIQLICRSLSGHVLFWNNRGCFNQSWSCWIFDTYSKACGTEAYSEPFHTSKIERFVKIVNSF